MEKSSEIYLAPLHGFTDIHYRNAHHLAFASFDKAITPFITLVEGKSVKTSHLRDIFPSDNLMPIDAQFIGNNADQFITLANALENMGYTTINWNLGCPVRAIARKQRGSGLLAYPDKIRRFLDQSIPHIKLSLSIKMRLGYADPQESFRVIDVLNDYPLDYVIIHARLGIQMYEGTVDNDALAERVKMLKHECIYNGDIFSLEDYNRIQNRFPFAKRVMIGRGILMDPFLASNLKGLKMSPEEKHSRFWYFGDLLLENYEKSSSSEELILRRIKAYWSKLRHPLCIETFERIKTITTIQSYKNEIESRKTLMFF